MSKPTDVLAVGRGNFHAVISHLIAYASLQHQPSVLLSPLGLYQNQ
jgi:hypothetical protein